jgi:UDP-GlcNAc:undecaprenyl-phosphate GlcNAc-1-phosphate transferase
VPAAAVTLVYWGFAAFGGICCLGFIAAPSPVKPIIPIDVLLPQIPWVIFVVRRARRAKLGAWG